MFDESKMQVTGKTIFETKTTTEYNAFPEYKKFLSLICAQNDRNNWISVGMAIKNCGGNLNDFVQYSKLGIGYEPGECNVFESFNTNGQCYGLSHLKRLAKLCNEIEFLKLTKGALYEYFNLNYDKINLLITL